MNQRGFTLVETLIAVALLAIAMIGILPAFATQLTVNGRSEQRSRAISASRQAFEALRRSDPTTLPDSDIGTATTQQTAIGRQNFSVVTRFCVRPEFCGASSRHVLVEIYADGRKIYDAETVFTQLL